MIRVVGKMKSSPLKLYKARLLINSTTFFFIGAYSLSATNTEIKKKFYRFVWKIVVSMNIGIDSTYSKLPMVTHLKSTADQRDHCEVTVWELGTMQVPTLTGNAFTSFYDLTDQRLHMDNGMWLITAQLFTRFELHPGANSTAGIINKVQYCRKRSGHWHSSIFISTKQGFQVAVGLPRATSTKRIAHKIWYAINICPYDLRVRSCNKAGPDIDRTQLKCICCLFGFCRSIGIILTITQQKRTLFQSQSTSCFHVTYSHRHVIST
jgi:hypothetical protein